MAKRKRDHRIKDARGRTVSQLDPFTLRLLRRHAVIPPEALDKITAEIGFGLQRWPRIMLIISLVCLAMCLIVIGVNTVHMLVTGSLDFREFLRTIAPFTGIWVGPFILWLGAYHIRFQRTAKVMLKHLRCPHCGYDLRGLPIGSDDGLTTCPECGCAWLLKSEEVHEQPSAGEHNGG